MDSKCYGYNECAMDILRLTFVNTDQIYVRALIVGASDSCLLSEQGVQYQVTCETTRTYVRSLAGERSG